MLHELEEMQHDANHTHTHTHHVVSILIALRLETDGSRHAEAEKKSHIQ